MFDGTDDIVERVGGLSAVLVVDRALTPSERSCVDADPAVDYLNGT